MKILKNLLNSKNTIRFNSILFFVAITVYGWFNIDIPFYLLWVMTIIFVFSIFFEFKDYKMDKRDNFKLKKYIVAGAGRFFLGATLILLIGSEVLEKNISLIIFCYSYICYLCLGVRFFRNKESHQLNLEDKI